MAEALRMRRAVAALTAKSADRAGVLGTLQTRPGDRRRTTLELFPAAGRQSIDVGFWLRTRPPATINLVRIRQRMRIEDQRLVDGRKVRKRAESNCPRPTGPNDEAVLFAVN